MENSNDSRNDGLDNQRVPEMDFWIHIDKHGMKSGFQPKTTVTGEEIVLCLSLGLRAMCCMMADKMECPLEEVHEALFESLQHVFSDEFEEYMGMDDDDEVDFEGLDIN